MGEFRDAVILWISLMPYLGGSYFWVVSYSTWSTSLRFNSAPPPSSSGACHRDELIANLDWSLGWEITLFLSAVLVFYYCRNLLDTAATIEAKLSPGESEVYEAARAELKEAMAALKIAEPASRESKRKRRDAASLKVERSKLKEGLERLSTVGRIWLRFCYLLAIGLSLMAGLSAVLTYYYSLELRSGCKTGFAGIFPFFVVGPIFLFYHIQSLIVGYHAY